MKPLLTLLAVLTVNATHPALAGSKNGIAPVLTSSVETNVIRHWESDPHKDLKGVVVLRNGNVVAEHYFNGGTRESLHDIRSAGKSITSLLVGISIDQRSIRGVGDPLETYFPELKTRPSGRITINNLLTMRSGLSADDDDPNSPGNENLMDVSADPRTFAFSIGMSRSPGTQYKYNSLTAYLAGLVVAQAARMPLDEVAKHALFEPLGITSWRWARDASGHTKGQGNLFMSTPDMAKIGQLVLDRGVFLGRRVVSESWISNSLTPHVSIGTIDPYADSYGYFWYTRTHQVEGREVTVHFASGNGGNKIYIIPSKRMVIAISSTAYGRAHGQRRSEAILKSILGSAR
jgi:CubicO group peptidase (beta-lactamase class C family)